MSGSKILLRILFQIERFAAWPVPRYRNYNLKPWKISLVVKCNGNFKPNLYICFVYHGSNSGRIHFIFFSAGSPQMCVTMPRRRSFGDKRIPQCLYLPCVSESLIPCSGSLLVPERLLLPRLANSSR